ncbi:hypothetical protein GQ457_01G017490 [Hibiscus cannabinus]
MLGRHESVQLSAGPGLLRFESGALKWSSDPVTQKGKSSENETLAAAARRNAGRLALVKIPAIHHHQNGLLGLLYLSFRNERMPFVVSYIDIQRKSSGGR